MAITSVFLTAVSLSSLNQPWCAIPAGVCATFLAIGAITGWCPTQLVLSREDPTPVNTFGYDEARQPIDIHSRP
ncbi:hypothetical protein [Microbacterium aurum]